MLHNRPPKVLTSLSSWMDDVETTTTTTNRLEPICSPISHPIETNKKHNTLSNSILPSPSKQQHSSSSIHETHVRLSAWQEPMQDFIHDNAKNKNNDDDNNNDDDYPNPNRQRNQPKQDQNAIEMNELLAAASSDTADSTTVLQNAVNWMDNGIASLQAELDKSIRDRSEQLIAMSKKSKINPRNIRLKVHCRQVIRIVNIDENSSFQQLLTRLASDFELSTSKLSLKYIDVDKDLITLSSQHDLVELMSLQLNTITVHIIAQLPISPIDMIKATLQPLRKISSSTSISSKKQRRNSKNTASINNWKLGEVLGRGAYGTVYLGFNLDNGELMAVKKLDTTDMSQTDLNETEKELKLLCTSSQTARLNHPNIVTYLGSERSIDTLCIFLEYVPGGSLKDLIKKFGILPEPLVRAYTRMILLGLEYLHHRGIAHRDIKGANLLITNEGVVKLADFGASKLSAGTITGSSLLTMSNESGSSMESGSGLKGTPCWMAPEVIKGEVKSVKDWQKADVWSVGCTIIEMATGKPPWSEYCNPLTAMYHIAMVGSTPIYPTTMSQNGLSFILLCMQRDVTKRSTCTKLLSNSFLEVKGISITPPTMPTMNSPSSFSLSSSSLMRTNIKPTTPSTHTPPKTPPRTGLLAPIPPLVPLFKSSIVTMNSISSPGNSLKKKGIRSSGKEKLNQLHKLPVTPHRWEHSFHSKNIRHINPPLAKLRGNDNIVRIGHIKHLGSIGNSNTCRSKSRSPFIKNMPWSRVKKQNKIAAVAVADNVNELKLHQGSEVMSFEHAPGFFDECARPTGAAGDGSGFLKTDTRQYSKAKLGGSRDWMNSSSVDTNIGDTKEQQLKEHVSSKTELEALSW